MTIILFALIGALAGLALQPEHATARPTEADFERTLRKKGLL